MLSAPPPQVQVATTTVLVLHKTVCEIAFFVICSSNVCVSKDLARSLCVVPGVLRATLS